jgi:hypothetical protein
MKCAYVYGYMGTVRLYYVSNTHAEWVNIYILYILYIYKYIIYIYKYIYGLIYTYIRNYTHTYARVCS